MAARSKLAVILHADVAGSTALVQIDERIAHERIRDAFEAAAAVIVRYDGNTRELRGDALLAEFQRASDAVMAALALQIANAGRNEKLGDEIRPVIRVGIALGEVVIADATVTGPGVVLAQRLEQLAAPGGVCIQGSAQESIPPRFPFDYQDLGNQTLKGFEIPIRAVAVTLRHGDSIPEPEPAASSEPQSEPQTERPGGERFAAVAISMLVIVAGLIAWWQPWTEYSGDAVSPTLAVGDSDGDRPSGDVGNEQSPPSLPDQPSIAVLAFHNMSDDPAQEYFADGISEDIITDLSKVSGLFVIARNSSFSYKGKNVPMKTLADALGVRYVLEGSVRRAGDTIRITAQLIDATTDGHLWAERYDGSISDVFGLQDRVAKKVVEQLSLHLKPDEEAAFLSRETDSANAYDAVLRGIRHLNAVDEWHQEANVNARDEFRRAISLDPNYARAIAGLAWTHWFDFTTFNFDAADIEQALALTEQSIRLGDNALARRLRARSHLQLRTASWGRSLGTREYDLAVQEMRRAVALEPQNADTLAELAFSLAYAGEPEEARALMERARRLNPNFPDWYHQPSGIAAFLLGDYETAVREFSVWFDTDLGRSVVSRAPVWLAAAQAGAGLLAESRQTLGAIKSAENLAKPRGALPNLFALRLRTPLKKQEHLDRFIGNLRLAGVPEEPD